VHDRVKRVVGSVLRVDPAGIADDARSEDVPGWDSLRHLELMLALETEFGVRIPAETMLELTSLPAIERFVAAAA
jgi:acyl carrier protein